ncbi:adenosylcobinamide-phosphate synthase CbiB [Gilvimarinus sp. 1_MG-2023]|uniref:adenosylcobinamide-phosphate synthase CbiB n=1 Tax=Gilvimarinus sp. 1_MG-2023 TaxID=3062638 RepID=UPI0026E311C9|nr:adenosylcobinamide-phosphate synthase CbiB [Gilvimarinus sp. 1_MG-2023]MDO6747956.1 adenosylcobinamide-phosphate synthase CbiB [Gilvimarinus sp. 1_MG-2023]
MPSLRAISELMNGGLLLCLCVLAGLLLDRLLGEPKYGHPLVGFGRIATWLEARLNQPINSRVSSRLNATIAVKALGVLAFLLATVPWLLLASWLWWGLDLHWLWRCLIGSVAVYLAVGWQSLELHVQAIVTALERGQLPQAQKATGLIVSRDCESLSEEGVVRAATESLLENTSDAVIAPLFWFAVAGVPGIVLYRLSNTLDAMWGYRNSRFVHFGWAAARFDDGLNFIPARISALALIVGALSFRGFAVWRQCACYWSSPNAGPVLAAGAGSLGIVLGGGASYHGVWQNKPATPGNAATLNDLPRAIVLTRRAVIISALALLLASLLWRGCCS